MSGAMWPCGKSYGPGWDFFSFRFSFSFFNSPVKVSAAILIDGHKLQLNTFFICLLAVLLLFLPRLTSGECAWTAWNWSENSDCRHRVVVDKRLGHSTASKPFSRLDSVLQSAERYGSSSGCIRNWLKTVQVLFLLHMAGFPQMYLNS